MTAHTPSHTPPPDARPSADAVEFAPPAAVRRRIASAIIGHVDTSLGDITLLPHQQDAVDRIHHALHDLHVALLADDVGLGKTFVALAVARRYTEICIIAPAALLPMWRHAVARAQLRQVELQSIQSYSRSGPRAGRVATRAGGTGLVIIDEAHHVRTPTTRRYRSIAERVIGRDLLLVSATPLHNTPRDLAAPLALALGEQAARLTPALLARVVVRRTHHGGRPAVREHPPLEMPTDRVVLDALLALPSPLPAHDGAVAGALIRLGLLRAWCSSDAALAQALRLRVLRAEALQHALQSGRHPTTAELRSWLVGDHEVQLAFPELMAGHAAESGALLDVLQRHLDAVRELLRRHQQRLSRATTPLPPRHSESGAELRRAGGTADRGDASLTTQADAERVRALKSIMQAHPDTPIVAFSQFAATVRSVGRALSDIAGVGVLTGRKAQIASGVISRGEALAAFAPRAQERPPPPPHQRIMLLLTTDLLAEGVNLQDAGVVVHLDLPWTDALRRQRVGRCVRVGSLHETVHVYTFAPPHGVDEVLRLAARLRRKAGLSTRLVGRATSRTGRDADVRNDDVRNADAKTGMGEEVKPGSSAAELATAVRGALTAWNHERVETSGKDAGDVGLLPNERITRPLVACVRADGAGFLAAVQLDDRDPASVMFVGGRHRRGDDGVFRWRVSASPRRLWPLVMHGGTADSSPHHACSDAQRRCCREHVRRARRVIRRWMARESLQRELQEEQAVDAAVHRRVRSALDDAVARVGPGARAALAAAHTEAVSALSRARGVAAEQALRAWLAMRPELDAAHWLTWWRQSTVLGGASREVPSRQGTDVHRACLIAALVFVPESDWKID
ncbi:MAG: DEAD/DEAH box helicase [Gemmatimonadaceae bacterium]|nr:DEAD/DEAH box helicase [Gemmatimonadaceae bacterium]